jgi:hypothetical protein
VAASRSTQNFTIEVPEGTINHGKPNFLCIPATWSDFATYLLLNYLAHGATVVSYPGEAAIDTLISVVASILFPGFGVKRAFNFIIRRPYLTAKNDLQMAARSGALCMLVRSSSWKPQKGDDIRNALIKDPGSEPSPGGGDTSGSDPGTDISPRYQPVHTLNQLNSRIFLLLYQSTVALSIYNPPWLNDKTEFWSYTDTDPHGITSRAIFGLSKPPDQYEFAFVPRKTVVLALVDSTPTPSSDSPDIPLLESPYRNSTTSDTSSKLPSSFNLVKGMVALLQSLYASFTLVRTNDGQLKHYGFAAPGLTVLPYAVMSTLNLMANLLAPHYTTMYLVRTKVMEEAERRTGVPFNCVVGKVVEESDSNDTVKEGWSEIAGTLKDDDKLLYASPSAEEDEEIEICDSSDKRVYVPACPRFRRTDDSQTSPLRQFIESPTHVLDFPQGHPASTDKEQLQRASQQGYGDALPGFTIFLTELFIVLGLSHFSGRQSTVAQRAWTISWLVAGLLGDFISDLWKAETSPDDSRGTVLGAIVFYCAPAIGGFVVVFQMLSVYGICYRFV